MNQTLRALVDQRLAAADGLSDPAAALIRAACDGESALRSALDGSEPISPASPGVDSPLASETNVGAYLASIAVEGFRGIGPRAELELDPAPGLTLVVGRNGSGKSSFAEGLELLLTGGVKRLEKRTKVWTDTWQCLHHDGPTRVAAELRVAGQDNPVTLACSWPHGAELTEGSCRAAVESELAQLGWRDALHSFRPFLAYSELATMFDTLASLYQALSPILGLEDADHVASRLSAERLALDNRRKHARKRAAELAEQCGHSDDPRASTLATALSRGKVNIDEVADLLAAAEDPVSENGDVSQLRARASLAVPPQEVVDAALIEWANATENVMQTQTTDLTAAAALAGLLTAAVDHVERHEVTDCPVCETPGAVGLDWPARARDRIAAVENQTRELNRARGALRAADARLQELVGAPAQELARTGAGDAALATITRWRDAPGDPSVTNAVVAALAKAQTAAAAEIASRDEAWKPLRHAVEGWITDARTVAAYSAALAALKEAEAWVKEATDDLRNARFAPIADAAKANWAEPSRVERRAA